MGPPQSTVSHPGSGEAQGSQTPAPGFTSLSRGWRRSLLQSCEGRRGPRHLTSWLLPSASWLRPGIPHHPQEFCTEPQFICEDMSRTDVCQGRLGETSESMLSPQILQVAAGPCSRPALASLPHPTPPSPPHTPLRLSPLCLLSPSLNPSLSSQVTAGFLRLLPPSLCTPDSCPVWYPRDRASNMATQVSSTFR